MKQKLLPNKSYGSIPHLPGSKTGPADRTVNDGQYRICCVKLPSKQYRVIVQEKLDGSNVSVANIDGVLTPLQRKGYAAISSPYEQHRLFANWVYENIDRFKFLEPGERLCGEWLAQAHATRYQLKHEPFVAFDLMVETDRVVYSVLQERAKGFVLPHLLHTGGPCSIEEACRRQNPNIHGAIDPIEGAVWRVEKDNRVLFLAKYVRSDMEQGKYLFNKENEVWNWRPGVDKQ